MARLLQSLVALHVGVAVILGALALQVGIPATEVSVGLPLPDGDAVKGLHGTLLAAFCHVHLGHHRRYSTG